MEVPPTIQVSPKTQALWQVPPINRLLKWPLNQELFSNPWLIHREGPPLEDAPVAWYLPMTTQLFFFMNLRMIMFRSILNYTKHYISLNQSKSYQIAIWSTPHLWRNPNKDGQSNMSLKAEQIESHFLGGIFHYQANEVDSITASTTAT